MRFNCFSLQLSNRIPDGYQLIEAYANGDDIVIPIMGIEDQNDLHNCDLEGCSSVDHVVRFNIRDKYKSAS